ncbi:hypothetical protein IC582_029369 [Cucumis melo]
MKRQVGKRWQFLSLSNLLLFASPSVKSLSFRGSLSVFPEKLVVFSSIGGANGYGALKKLIMKPCVCWKLKKL